MSTGLSVAAGFNPRDEALTGWDRAATLARFRELDTPVVTDVLGRPWLFRYDDIQSVLLDKDRFKAGGVPLARALGFTQGPVYDFMDFGILTQDPPDHTRIRHAAGFFSRHMVSKLEPVIREAANALVDAFPVGEPVNFSEAFAFRLPVGVIMRMLKLPESDEARIRELSPNQLPNDHTPEALAVTDAANLSLRRYAEEVCAERRARPVEDDVVSELVALQGRGELSEDELWALIVSLIVAGHETTTSALSLGLHALLTHRDQWERLRADRQLLPNAAEEILRFEPPVEGIGRVPVEDIELHGVPVKAGTVLALSMASANRDPRTFEDPDAFDVSRPNARSHLSFAAGIHRCLGAPLAQLEIAAALDVLLDRFATVELAGEAILGDRQFRGFANLPITVTLSGAHS